MPERDDVTIPGTLRFISDGTTIGSRLECLGRDGRWTSIRAPLAISINADGADRHGGVRARVTVQDLPLEVTIAPDTLVYELSRESDGRRPRRETSWLGLLRNWALLIFVMALLAYGVKHTGEIATWLRALQ